MHFSTFLATSALAVLAAAQGTYKFTMATIPPTIVAGSTFNITWSPPTGSVTLLLVQAAVAGTTNVHTVDTIASKFPEAKSLVSVIFSVRPITQDRARKGIGRKGGRDKE